MPLVIHNDPWFPTGSEIIIIIPAKKLFNFCFNVHSWDELLNVSIFFSFLPISFECPHSNHGDMNVIQRI